MSAIVLLAHGSPNPRHAMGVRAFAARIGAATNEPVSVAFLEHDAPTLAQAVGELAVDDVVVVPLFASSGYHHRVDVPAALAAAATSARLQLSDATGLDASLAEFFDRELPHGAVVLVSAPTRDDGSAAEALGLALAARGGRVVHRASVPELATKLAEVEAAGDAAAIGLLLLGEGELVDSVRMNARRRVVTPPLLEAPELVDIVLARVAAVELAASA